MAIAALAIIDAVSLIPQMTRREVPRAARIEADQRIWGKARSDTLGRLC